ncbi:MAG TPA: TIGR02281 family clan AA aspartic protease [Methylophilaceae bacterium]|nr:TIGR02281 family clan AA aspartic protease [Methylophilaceae bacterium]HAJ72371.1 TIGR02281 family clan AA aspartic protease [Methylophilaceae bacterium]
MRRKECLVNSKKILGGVVVLFLEITSLVYADTKVNVVGLFNGKAVVIIDGGAPQTMMVGQTKGAVKLVTADSQKATFLIDGATRALGMGQGVSVGGSSDAGNGGEPVRLYADSTGQFVGNLSINGASMKYVVDTGATTVAINSADAKRARVNYLNGEKSIATTAGGAVEAYRVKLNTLKIGTIVLNNVDAAVIEGGYPEMVLLGSTALTRLDMKRENSVMTLTKKY